MTMFKKQKALPTTKKIIRYTGCSEYDTMITRYGVEWTFYAREKSGYAFGMLSWYNVYELNAPPRLVLKLMKVL
jgi:hypothetical protein